MSFPGVGHHGEQHAAVERDARPWRRGTRCSRRGSSRGTASPVEREPQAVRCGRPRPGRRRASSEHRSPGAPAQLGTVAHDRDVASPSRASTRTPASSATPRRSTLARKWSSRPPWPPTTTTRRHRGRARRASASSRSVASFAVGWRSTAAPAATAASSVGTGRPSRGRRRPGRPRRRGRGRASRPESAAITRSTAGRSRSAVAAGGSPPANTERGDATASHGSLRRHYPVQVRGVGDACAVALSARLTRAPRGCSCRPQGTPAPATATS